MLLTSETPIGYYYINNKVVEYETYVFLKKEVIKMSEVSTYNEPYYGLMDLMKEAG